ncbi:MAG: 50S ribosomal protein L25, partial [Flavobacteriaceae bacterium]|nr:50S ribosomal protein L25 [Flavobacteriaceae bacterium]
MKSITIKGSKRESAGKKASKALRNAGMIPCVIYGGDKTLQFSASEVDLKPLVYTPNVFTATIELEDGVTINAILKDIQFHPVSDKFLHVDFYQLFEDKEITMNIPVKL